MIIPGGVAGGRGELGLEPGSRVQDEREMDAETPRHRQSGRGRLPATRPLRGPRWAGRMLL